MLLLLKCNINTITVVCHDCSLTFSLSSRLILSLFLLAVIKKVNKLLAASLRFTNPFFVISVHGVAKRLDVSSRLGGCHRKRKIPFLRYLSSRSQLVSVELAKIIFTC